MVLRKVITLLMVENASKSVPRPVVSIIAKQCLPEVRGGPFEVFVMHGLVTTQRVRVREVRIYLNGALEEFNGGVRLSLQRKAISP